LRLLGEGAHGLVFEATKDGRPVAVKVASDLEYASYLAEENRFLAQVGAHAAKKRSADAPKYFPQAKLVRVPATDRLRETNVLEMERVARSASDTTSAESLGRIMKRGPVDEALARSLLVHLPRALEQLHEAGIVHRDLKPANILVTEANLPVLVDFGIAAPAGGQPDHLGHGPGMTSGTMAYMGPEQLLGAQASPRMDVFAAKKLLLEALVGEDRAGRYTEPLQTDPDPAKQANEPEARRWLRAPEDKLGRLAVVLTTNVLRDGRELRGMIELAEARNVSDETFYRALGAHLSRETPERIVEELLCSKTLIEKFPDGLGFDATTTARVRDAVPEVLRRNDRTRRDLMRTRQASMVIDGNPWGYEAELQARVAPQP
jgi:serine/threonine protein kinase